MKVPHPLFFSSGPLKRFCRWVFPTGIVGFFSERWSRDLDFDSGSRAMVEVLVLGLFLFRGRATDQLYFQCFLVWFGFRQGARLGWDASPSFRVPPPTPPSTGVISVWLFCVSRQPGRAPRHHPQRVEPHPLTPGQALCTSHSITMSTRPKHAMGLSLQLLLPKGRHLC